MLYLALRHILARKKQTVLTMLGVALGTGSFITFAAIMTGFQGFIIDQLVNNDAHVRIQARDEILDEKELRETLFSSKERLFWMNPPNSRQYSVKINHPLGWFERLRADERVLAYAPQITVQTIFTRGSGVQGGKITGVLAVSQSHVTNIESYMISGNFHSLDQGGQQIVIGKGLSEKLGARVGDTVNISTGITQSIPFKVSGIFKVGVQMIDDSSAFASLYDVQQAARKPTEITDIAIRLTDVNDAQSFAGLYASLAEDKVLSWDQSNANILGVFSLQNFIRTFISISIMVVASFGIYNILNILVNQKRKDIGILRSMGFESADIVRLFLIQGSLLGSIGGVLGLGFGFIMSKIIGQFKIGGFTGGVIINYSPQIYGFGILIALGSAIFSSYLPARSAGKLRPIDIVRASE